jgi:hypothetical protein
MPFLSCHHISRSLTLRSIGRALFDALDLLIAQDRFPSQHGYKVVSNFDIVIAEVLRKITSKVSVKV